MVGLLESRQNPAPACCLKATAVKRHNNWSTKRSRSGAARLCTDDAEQRRSIRPNGPARSAGALRAALTRKCSATIRPRAAVRVPRIRELFICPEPTWRARRYHRGKLVGREERELCPCQGARLSRSRARFGLTPGRRRCCAICQKNGRRDAVSPLWGSTIFPRCRSRGPSRCFVN